MEEFPFDDEYNSQDLGRQRVVEERGQVFTIEAEDPYGFWSVKSNGNGPVPKALKGQFTSQDEAAKAIAVYMNTKKLKGK